MRQHIISDNAILPDDAVEAEIDRLGNMEFLQDQMFSMDDRIIPELQRLSVKHKLIHIV